MLADPMMMYSSSTANKKDNDYVVGLIMTALESALIWYQVCRNMGTFKPFKEKKKKLTMVLHTYHHFGVNINHEAPGFLSSNII